MMDPDGIHRRDLFRTGAMAMTAGSYSRIAGANDRIRMGLVGCGSRGQYLLRKCLSLGVEPVALCDVYGAKTEQARTQAPGATLCSDHRQLVERNDLDLVVIATPDHWHAPIAIDSMNAGKDVYVEKPLTLTIDEGPEIVRAARVDRRICQVGMQRRSTPHYYRARGEIVRQGKLGKVMMVRTWWNGQGDELRIAPPELRRQPADLDWARYLGRARWHDYDPQRYWNFRGYLEFGGGQLTDLFVHLIDAVHLVLEQDDPVAAVASGGIYCHQTGRTAPDTICCQLEYRKGWTVTYEGVLTKSAAGVGTEIYGSEGRLELKGGGAFFRGIGKDAEEITIPREKGDAVVRHIQNLLDCMRSRKRPNADVHIGHRSAIPAHLANLAYVQKRRLKFDPDREAIFPL